MADKKPVLDELYSKLQEFFQPRVQAAQNIGQSAKQFNASLDQPVDIHPISEQLADMFDPKYSNIAKFTSDMYSRMKKHMQESLPK